MARGSLFNLLSIAKTLKRIGYNEFHMGKDGFWCHYYYDGDMNDTKSVFDVKVLSDGIGFIVMQYTVGEDFVSPPPKFDVEEDYQTVLKMFADFIAENIE